MASTLSLRNRIKTAQNVSKTTKAMQMIAASKLKRAQETTFGSRPYVEKLSELAQGLSLRVEKEALHPYMKTNKSNKTLVLVLSPDKGLCGGLITNLVREFLKLDMPENYIFVDVGRKMENILVRLKKELIASFLFGNTLPDLDTVYPIEKIINDYFLSQEAGSVKILYTHFSSFFSQAPRIETILPITFIQHQTGAGFTPKQFELFEPNIKHLLPGLLEHYLQMTIYQYLLESFLSEQAARMFAMQNATNNANDIISELKLEYNKVRQATITNEILDISSVAAFV